MKKRGLGIVVLILIASIVVAFYAIKRNREKNVQKFIETHAVQLNAKNIGEIVSPDKINEMQIVNPNGQFRFRKEQNGVWMLLEPVQTRANQNSVIDLLGILADMKVDSYIEKNPKNTAIYGLDDPDIKVKYKLEGSQNWREIDFGRRSPIEGSYYAMDPDRKEVILVPFGDKFEFNGNLMIFRDTKIFPFNAYDADQVVFSFPDKTYEFNLDENIGMWRISKPFIGIANEKFPLLLSNISGVEIAGFLSNTNVPEKTGMDTPALVVLLHNPQKGTEELIIGGGKEETFRCAKLANEKQIFLVKSENWLDPISAFIKNPERSIAFYFPFVASSKVLFEKNGKTLEFHHQDERAAWQITGLENREVDQGKLFNCLLSLGKTPNRGYVGATPDAEPAMFGFDKPTAIITWKLFPGKTAPERKVVFGKPDHSGKYVYIYTDADPNIRLVDKKTLDLIPINATEYIIPGGNPK